MFSFVLTKWILLAARQTAVATCRRSDRKPVGLPFRLQTENILLLPLIPTQRILLFHQPQAGPPFSPEREMFRKLSFAPTYKTLLSTRQTAVAVCRQSDFRWSTQACFPLFTHRGINYPPSDKSDGPPFSPERSFVLQVSLVLTLAFLFFTREYSAAPCHSR